MRPGVPLSIARAAVLCWFAGALIVGAALLAKHVVALPVPSSDEHLSRSLGALRIANERGQWLAIHVLYAECRCSQRIVTHLLTSARPSGVHETVLWIGQAAPPPELSERFRVLPISNAQLARLGIVAAPMFVVLGPRDQIRYIGGYSERKQGPELDDLSILAAARHGKASATHPVFGCAANEQLRRRLSLFTGL